MTTIVCGQNNWPITSVEQACALPEVLLKGIEAFSTFYGAKHAGRKLTFRAEHGNVEVKVRFAARSHELTVATHGMVVLALFEGLGPDESLSCNVRNLPSASPSPIESLTLTRAFDSQDIAIATKMPAPELRRTLQSLACAKYKILNKTPRSRDVDDADTFSFNSTFACNLAKIKIQTVANKVESAEERKETEGKVEEERRTLYDVRFYLQTFFF